MCSYVLVDVCVYEYVYVCVYVCVYAYLHVRTYAFFEPLEWGILKCFAPPGHVKAMNTREHVSTLQDLHECLDHHKVLLLSGSVMVSVGFSKRRSRLLLG